MAEQETIVIDGRKATDVIRTIMGVGGLVSLVIGVLILINPVQSGAVMMKFVAIIFAIYMTVTGLVFLGSMIFSKTMSGWRRVGNAVLGLLYLIAGIIVFGNLGATAAVLTAVLSIFIGVLWIFEGIMSFAAARESKSKTWSIIYGSVSIIAGIVLIVTPLAAAVTLWLLVGISMAIMGVVQIVRAFTLKPAK
ncbi:MAG: DUF308 domain-containing protein [Actinobacteria bacterium]|jgi:uncharacterized membrane protein HdeD (DUF308 family)|nr:DUF308 domain-containing protein [Actinomycetota bacterium]